MSIDTASMVHEGTRISTLAYDFVSRCARRRRAILRDGQRRHLEIYKCIEEKMAGRASIIYTVTITGLPKLVSRITRQMLRGAGFRASSPQLLGLIT
jgi:hypothetical protein